MDGQLTVKTWKDVKDSIYKLNPNIAAEFDKVVGIDQFPIIQVKYPYGASIIDEGKFKLNIEGQIVDWDSDLVPERIKAMLNYKWDTIPLGLVSKNSFEAFIKLPSHVVPLRLLTQGSLFSLLSVFEKDNKFVIPGFQSASAGGKSIFTLPEIAHKQYGDRLVKRYTAPKGNLSPKGYNEHWALLKDIANTKEFRTPWHCELMFFSKPFIDRIEQNYRLKAYLLQAAWNFTGYSRMETKYNMLWNVFLTENLKLSVRNAPFIIETAKHIIKIAMSRVPGFMPARTDIAAPIVELSNIFTNVYKIRTHIPVFMQLTNYDGINPIYYSLHHHTFLHPFPKKKGSSQTINELKTIKYILELFTQCMNEGNLAASLEGTQLFETLNNIEIDYFHTLEKDGFVTNFSDLLDNDPRFTQHIKGVIPRAGLEFPKSCPFFKGCIRIRPKE